MAFYDLSKAERNEYVNKVEKIIQTAFTNNKLKELIDYFADEDTYIRKAAYLSVGRIYLSTKSLQPIIISTLVKLLAHQSFRVRQTVINAAGEIGKKDFATVTHIFDKGLFDAHHSPCNAVIGSIKKMGELNPEPVLRWAKKYIHHPDVEIRRQICHGIELRGRKHPQDILPLLKELQFDEVPRVRKTLVHVIGQISYKQYCLPAVISHLKTWENNELVSDAINEIIDVHERYKSFAALTQEAAKDYIYKEFEKR